MNRESEALGFSILTACRRPELGFRRGPASVISDRRNTKTSEGRLPSPRLFALPFRLVAESKWAKTTAVQKRTAVAFLDFQMPLRALLSSCVAHLARFLASGFGLWCSGECGSGEGQGSRRESKLTRSWVVSSEYRTSEVNHGNLALRRSGGCYRVSRLE
jgi:hypothetical protein